MKRVLNLSVVWHVRRTRSLAGPDADRFRKSILSITRKSWIGEVNVNNSQDNDPARFKGLMLGDLLKILESPRLTGLSSEMRGITGAKQLLQTIEDKSDSGVYHKLT